MNPKIIIVTEFPFVDPEPTEIGPYNYLSEFMDVALTSNGIEGTTFSPTEPIEAENAKSAIDALVDNICAQLTPDRLNLIGISMYSATARYGFELAARLKKRANKARTDIMIIGGGSLFYKQSLIRDGKTIADSIDFALAQNASNGIPILDGAVFGGLQAFIDISRQIGKGNISKNEVFFPTKLPNGYYFKENGIVRGSGISLAAHMDYAPFEITQFPSGKFKISAMYSNLCQNACYFCRNGVPIRFSTDQVKYGIKNLIAQLGGDKEKVKYLYQCDPNPFSPINRAHTDECMEIVDSEIGHTLQKIVFYDSALFADPEQVIVDTTKWGIRQYGIGRETATEHAASFIGEKYCGRIKTQDMLDAERRGIEEVVGRVKKLGKRIAFELYYIISPNDTAETLNQTFDEMGHFAAMTDNCTIIAIKFALLSPNPGTTTLSQNVDLICQDSYATKTSYDRWDGNAITRLYPNSVFPMLKRNPLFSDYSDTWQYNPTFHKAVKELH